MCAERFGARYWTALIIIALGLSVPLAAQQAAPAPQQQDDPAQQAEEPDPLKRPLTKKELKEREKALRRELGDSYKKWIDEDVRWIISGEELSAFKQLSNDEERDQFIEQFWLRRDPTPDSIENEFREEHYRRIAYANERFASGVPGWRTDRGRIYIMFGAPDSIEGSPSGGSYQRPFEEGGGTTSVFPFEVWRYRYLEDIGQEVMIEFVDKCMCGEFRMTMDRSEKDALLHVPGAGLTFWEEMGMSSKVDRFTRPGLERLGVGPGQDLSTKQFDRLDLYSKLSRPPAIKFKDLEEVVDTKIRYNMMPFDVRADFVRVTSDTVLVPITLQIKNRDITFVSQDGVQRGLVNIFGRVSTMTGRRAQTFEDTVSVDIPQTLFERTIENASVYWKALPLRPGRYRLDIVVKDVNGDRLGTWTRGILVPDFGDENLAASSLILADLMEKVPTRAIGSGNFVLGTTKVRPRVDGADGKPAKIKRGQNLNLWMQVYNLSLDDGTNKPSATIEYEVVNTATKQSVVKTMESTADMGNVGDQLTLEKSLALDALEPGTYQVTVRVNDNISKQTLAPTARFIVE